MGETAGTQLQETLLSQQNVKGHLGHVTWKGLKFTVWRQKVEIMEGFCKDCNPLTLSMFLNNNGVPHDVCEAFEGEGCFLGARLCQSHKTRPV